MCTVVALGVLPLRPGYGVLPYRRRAVHARSEAVSKCRYAIRRLLDYAALKGCAVTQHVVITGSSMSYDQAVHTYYPYDCRNPDG